MAKRANYGFEKRQKDLRKQEKKLRKAEKKRLNSESAPGGDQGEGPDGNDAGRG